MFEVYELGSRVWGLELGAFRRGLGAPDCWFRPHVEDGKYRLLSYSVDSFHVGISLLRPSL